jgi:hypothetical protein
VRRLAGQDLLQDGRECRDELEQVCQQEVVAGMEDAPGDSRFGTEGGLCVIVRTSLPASAQPRYSRHLKPFTAMPTTSFAHPG